MNGYANFQSWDVIHNLHVAFGWFCPVDAKVYNSKGEIVASVINNEANYYDSLVGEVMIFIQGDEKVIVLPDNDEYRVELIGTDSGEMEYWAFKMNLADQYVTEEKVFEKVQLELDKQMISNGGSTINSEDVPLLVIGDKDEVIADVTEDGSEIDSTVTEGELKVTVNGKNAEIAKIGLYNSGLSESFIKSDIKSDFKNAYSKGNNISANQYEISYPKLSSYKLAVLKPGYLSKVTDISSKESSELEVKLREYGDVDGNEEIDVADLSLTSGYILSDIDITDDNTEASDFNQDGVIDVADLAGISARILAG